MLDGIQFEQDAVSIHAPVMGANQDNIIDAEVVEFQSTHP